MRMQKLMETNMTTKITQSHTATLSAIHDAWEQLLKSRGLDFVEGPAAIVEAEGEAYLISWKVKGQRPYWLIVTYAMTGGLHQGVTRFGIDGHGFEFSIRVPAKNKERSPSDKVCAMLTNLIGTARPSTCIRALPSSTASKGPMAGILLTWCCCFATTAISRKSKRPTAVSRFWPLSSLRARSLSSA